MSVLGFQFAALALFLLSACAFNNDPYPPSWGALPAPQSEDCRHFEGSYGDRGDTSASSPQPSLTVLLFGDKTEGSSATRVTFSLPRNDALEVVGWQGTHRVYSRTLTTQAGEFACEKGRLVVREGRWISKDQAIGRVNATMEFNTAGDHLIVQVKAFAVLIPLIASQTSWYRFPRLRE